MKRSDLKGTILLCDDEYLIRTVGRKLLYACGFDTVTVESGAEALETVLKQRDVFDAIILDMEMPEFSGLDVYIELGKRKIDIPVILSTGHVDDDLLEMANNVGITYILKKPYTLKDLRKILQNIKCV